MIEKNPELHLGGCYHTGLVYALGYDANGEIELCSELYTNLSLGVEGGALAALAKHREEFCKDHDIERFVVALKPVQIMEIPDRKRIQQDGDDIKCKYCGEKQAESDKCEEQCCDDCPCNCDCLNCNSEIERCPGCSEPLECCFCENGYEDECIICDLNFDECTCYGQDIPCSECGDETSQCNCDDQDLEKEFICDSFKPMNAFDRARWVKAQEKGN